MRKILALVVLLALTAPAVAADNTLLVTPCAAGCITTRSKDVGAGVQAPMPIMSDASGTAIYGTAGTANANVLTVQGIAAMTPLIVTNSGTFAVQAAQSGTWNITNVSGTVSLPTGAATAANQAIVNTWAGGTLGAMANYGTSPGAVLVPGVNAAITSWPATPPVGLADGAAATGTTGSKIDGVGSGATGGLITPVRTCDLQTYYDGTTNGLADFVTVAGNVAGRKVYICGYKIATGGTATNVSLWGGTGAACVTTSNQLTPAWQLAANDKIGDNSDFWNGLVSVNTGERICIKTSAGNAVQAEIRYTIQ